MKKNLFICIISMFFCCNLVYAANENITAILNKQLKIVCNNEIQEFKNVNGEKVYPISYQGSTYLPIRSISSLFNTKIKWDGNTNSIYLGEGEEDTISAQKIMNFISQESTEIYAILNQEIKIYHNNVIQSFKDETGNVVYPISYQGTTYLPVRAVSNLFDLNIEWDGKTKTVTINEKIVEVKPNDTTSNDELIIPDIPTESFSKKAKKHTTSNAYLTDVGIVYTNSGIGFDENGKFTSKVSPIYLEFVNVYTGEEATKIIEKYNRQAFLPYDVKENSKLYCALFNVDLCDYIYNDDPNDNFLSISFAPIGSVSIFDLSNGQIGTSNMTIIDGETNKVYYNTGDITQIYAVFEVPNEVSISAISIDFINETDHSSEKFFKSYLF